MFIFANCVWISILIVIDFVLCDLFNTQVHLTLYLHLRCIHCLHTLELLNIPAGKDSERQPAMANNKIISLNFCLHKERKHTRTHTWHRIHFNNRDYNNFRMVIVEYRDIIAPLCIGIMTVWASESSVIVKSLQPHEYNESRARLWIAKATLTNFFSSFLQHTNVGINSVNARARAHVLACVHTISVGNKHLNCYIVWVNLRKFFYIILIVYRC